MKPTNNSYPPNRELFSGQDSCNLAWLIYRRFGRDMAAAASAWRRLLGNSCSDSQFAELVQGSSMNDEVK